MHFVVRNSRCSCVILLTQESLKKSCLLDACSDSEVYASDSVKRVCTAMGGSTACIRNRPKVKYCWQSFFKGHNSEDWIIGSTWFLLSERKKAYSHELLCTVLALLSEVLFVSFACLCVKCAVFCIRISRVLRKVLSNNDDENFYCPTLKKKKKKVKSPSHIQINTKQQWH